ncbi:ankyrin repeat domain protein [Trichonephila clavata]|uniref:Ankyrin repeat domain protein n=1 Tax=Trichonephila clavata TaxID=2740835 RepID=A0A8X6K6D6_TRICU|nr:ankyrin repeat domain protein [Trichonephila clavata]
MYELVREHFYSLSGHCLINTVEGSLDNLIHMWFVKSDLTDNQKKLNIELLNILSAYSGEEDVYVARLKKFLEKNGKSEDLTTILNCKRGESGFTILHAVSSMSMDEACDRAVGLLLKAGADPSIKNDRGQTPLHYAATGYDSIVSLIKAGVHPNIQDIEGRAVLHYAAGIDSDGEAIELLIKKGAKRDILDKQGKTPLQVAVDNGSYNDDVAEYLCTNNQKGLKEELYNVVYKHKDSSDYIVKLTKDLKEFLRKYKGNQDLEVVLNTLGEVEVKVLLHAANYFGGSQAATEVENLLSEAGATTILKGPVESYSPKSRSLWSNLIPSQQRKLREIFGKVSQAQDIDQLEKVVDEAIKSGVRFNFSQQISPDETIGKWGRKYNLLDCIIARISELGKNPKVASDIVCKLVSKGAVLHNSSSIDVINTLESEFKDHKTNMKKAYEEYVNNTLEFMKIAKNAANGEVKDAKMDNSTFYLEYSEDSKIDVAKITDGARSLGLTQGEIEYGRDIIKIGKSEVEIITQKGIRYYTDLADGSDIVLTFSTSLGELEVNLYPDKQDKIIVKVSNKKEILEKFKDCKEELGKNCSLGGYLVYNAIERGYFERSGKLCQPSEIMSSPVQQSHGYELQPTKQQLLQDLRNVESNVIKKEKDFDTKTHLIDIFKILYKLLGDKENVSKTDLANVAEKESKRLGLEGRYNWNELFGLEKAVSQNIEQEGSSLPLSSDLYRQDKLASSVNNKVEKCTTKGDGNCFFHAVFGDSSSGVYKTDRAKEMRQEWHKFLSQFESLDDPKMPKALRERLSLVFHNVFQIQESGFCTSNLYKEYLSKVNEQSYFIYLEEVPILASLASTEIELYCTQGSLCKIKPNPGMINADYKTNQELWGSKVQEAIYLEGNHYSRAEVMAQSQKQMQEQRNVPCSNLLSCSAEEAKFNQQQSPQQALTV